MAKQINQYTKTRTSGTVKNDDYLDLDSTEDSGTTFESAKIKVSEFLSYLGGQLTTLYTGNGTLPSNRQITASTFFTKWLGGDVIVEAVDEISDYGFAVNNSGTTEVARLGVDNATSSGVLEVSEGGGVFFEANDGEIKVNTDVLYVDGDSVNLNTLTSEPNFCLNIRSEGSVNPISIYEDRVGGAVNGDNNSINFYYNDSSGAKTLAGVIGTRVTSAPTAGNIPMDMFLNDNFKIQNNGRALITPNVSTQASLAQFEVRGDNTSTNTTALFKSGVDTTSGIVLWCKNSGNKNLMYIDATAKHFHNVSKLTTGDFQMSGGVDTHAFYFNAGTDNTGFGTNNASEKVHSTEKVRADTGFNFNGNNGITEVLTFGGGATGDVASLTVEGGIITSRTLVP